jgi:hypothetical protein
MDVIARRSQARGWQEELCVARPEQPLKWCLGAGASPTFSAPGVGCLEPHMKAKTFE